MHNKLITLTCIVFTGIVITAVLFYKSSVQFLDSERWVEHTVSIINQSDKILLLVKETESAERGFAITGDSSYIKDLPGAGKTTKEYIRHLKMLAIDNERLGKQLDTLDFYLQARLAFSSATVAMRSNTGLWPALEHIYSGRGEAQSRRIQRIVTDIKNTESNLLTQRQVMNQHRLHVFNLFSVSTFILMMLFTILLMITTVKYLVQNKEKEKRAEELIIANEKLAYENDKKEKLASELVTANSLLAFENREKENRAAELLIANNELAYQNEQKENRAAELVIANGKLVFENEEKEQRAAELCIANHKLAYENEQKEKRAGELVTANSLLAFENKEKEQRAAELVTANTELAYQNAEKASRAAELLTANIELAYQNEEKEKRASEYRQLVERVSDAFIALDINFNITYVNKQAGELLKKSIPELLGKNMWTEFPDAKDMAFHEAYQQVLKTQKNIHVREFSFATGVWLEANIYPSATGVSVYFRDITEQMASEENVRLLENQILEQKATQRRKISRVIIVSQEKERDHIGKELHDNINQILAGTKIYLGLACQRSDECKELLKYPMELLDSSMEEIRLLSHKLVAPAAIRLEDMLDALVQTLEQKAIHVSLFVSLEDELLSDDLKLNIYRVMQESVHNILKYAKASTVRIFIEKLGDNIVIKIADNGVGFDVTTRRKGIGISNMINRVESFNGTLRISSTPGMGCKTVISIPLEIQDADAVENTPDGGERLGIAV